MNKRQRKKWFRKRCIRVGEKKPKYTLYDKPYPTIGDLIKGKNYDYVSYRLEHRGEYEFAGCFKVEDGEIIPLDYDTYYPEEEVVASEEWIMPEEGIFNGLSVVCECEWLEG